MRSRLYRAVAIATTLVVAFAAGCSKSPGKLGQACDSTDGCENPYSCVSGTCFQLCATDADCAFGTCRTLTSDDGKTFNACTQADGGSSGGSSGSSGSSGTGSDTCTDTTLCAGHTIKSCATANGASCYYLVDGSEKYPCNSGCNCQTAAQQIVNSVCQ